jgi:oxygen-independent coproporphyrinogen-3 oxidase
VRYDASQAAAYVDALCSELRQKKSLAGTLRSVYIGGGTPTVLPDKCLIRLFACLREHFSFSPSAEITIETNPGTITKEKLEILISLGVNRISIGVQSFDDRELVILGRIHNAQEAAESIRAVQAAGLSNVSLDLIYGIPGQTGETWRRSLSLAAALSPRHISAYELTPEPGTPLWASLEAQELILPAEDSVLSMFDCAIDFLAGKGYEHYEISNYAIPGFRCVHNLNYWNRGEYIGAGAGAHSFIQGIRSKNTDDVSEYAEKLKAGFPPEKESSKVGREDTLKEFIMLGLRKTEGISLHEAEAFGIDLPGVSSDLIAEGFAEIKDDRMRLTGKGLPVSNAVIVRLFQNLGL